MSKLGDVSDQCSLKREVRLSRRCSSISQAVFAYTLDNERREGRGGCLKTEFTCSSSTWKSKLWSHRCGGVFAVDSWYQNLRELSLIFLGQSPLEELNEAQGMFGEMVGGAHPDSLAVLVEQLSRLGRNYSDRAETHCTDLSPRGLSATWHKADLPPPRPLPHFCMLSKCPPPFLPYILAPFAYTKWRCRILDQRTQTHFIFVLTQEFKTASYRGVLCAQLKERLPMSKVPARLVNSPHAFLLNHQGEQKRLMPWLIQISFLFGSENCFVLTLNMQWFAWSWRHSRWGSSHMAPGGLWPLEEHISFTIPPPAKFLSARDPPPRDRQTAQCTAPACTEPSTPSFPHGALSPHAFMNSCY